MNQYQAPKTNPEEKVHVANAISVEMNEDTYFTAKLQNRIRWGLVLGLAVGSFFLFGGLGYLLSCAVGIAAYFALSIILPMSNLTSTTKFKKYGEKMKMDKMNRKLGIGDYAKKDEE